MNILPYRYVQEHGMEMSMRRIPEDLFVKYDDQKGYQYN